jgi:hypothetical protein
MGFGSWAKKIGKVALETNPVTAVPTWIAETAGGGRGAEATAGLVNDAAHAFADPIAGAGAAGATPSATSTERDANGNLIDPSAQLAQDTRDAAANRDRFAKMALSGTGNKAPVEGAVRIDTQQSNQARGTQGTGIGVQQQGVGVLGQGLSTQLGAAQSYRDVLSGNTPSVAELTANRLAGQNIAAMYGGAASAHGAARAGALRAAINGAGVAGAQGAAAGGIQRAAEQDQARAGLLGAGTAIGNTGSAISGVGQGITAGGTSIRGQDITGAGNQAQLDQNTQRDNAGNVINTNQTDAGYRAALAQASNQAGSTAVTGSASKVTGDLNKATFDKEHQSIWSDASDALGKAWPGNWGTSPSSEAVKTDIQPAGAAQVTDLFKSLAGITSPTAQQGTPTPTGSLIAAAPHGGGSSLNLGNVVDAGVKYGPAIATALSSEKVKNDIKPGTPEARQMFASIVPKTWKYDAGKLGQHGLPEPGTEGRDHLGVIAEDVEKAGPLGRGMVEDVNGVKSLNLPMAVSALMAAMADIMRHGHGGKQQAA